MAPLGYEKMEVTDIGKEKKPVKHLYFVQIKPEMDGKNVTEAFQTQDEFGQRRIILNFNNVGANRFAEVTRDNVNRQLAIVLDDKLYCAPVIRTVIDGGRAEISAVLPGKKRKILPMPSSAAVCRLRLRSLPYLIPTRLWVRKTSAAGSIRGFSRFSW